MKAEELEMHREVRQRGYVGLQPAQKALKLQNRHYGHVVVEFEGSLNQR